MREGGLFMEKIKKQPICPKCGSKTIQARIKTSELYCRRCGYVGKKEKFFKEDKNNSFQKKHIKKE